MRDKPRMGWWLAKVSLALTAVVLTLFGFHRYHYPHGIRSGKLTTFMGVLTEYAMDHGGRHPEGGRTPLESLQRLYPKYASREIAGMSGDEKKVEAYLRKGEPIDTNISSWIYFPGYSIYDNPEIAIIWECEPGIFVNGQRGDGYAVGFVGGGYDQIFVTNWATFVNRQKELRDGAR